MIQADRDTFRRQLIGWLKYNDLGDASPERFDDFDNDTDFVFSFHNLPLAEAAVLEEDDMDDLFGFSDEFIEESFNSLCDRYGYTYEFLSWTVVYLSQLQPALAN